MELVSSFPIVSCRIQLRGRIKFRLKEIIKKNYNIVNIFNYNLFKKKKTLNQKER